MNELFSVSAYFYTGLTLVSYGLFAAVQKKTRLVILNPIILAALAIMGILALLDIPVEVYQTGCTVLSYLLTPATICLAISFYEQFSRLKKQILPIMVGVLAGVFCSIGSIWLLAKLFAVPDVIMLSILPKSVTAAIGVPLAEEIGGIGAITTAAISIAGIFGNIMGPTLCKWLGLKNPVAQGVAIGTASHVIGTARAFEMSELAGAVGTLSLTVAGISTSIFLSLLAPYL